MSRMKMNTLICLSENIFQLMKDDENPDSILAKVNIVIQLAKTMPDTEELVERMYEVRAAVLERKAIWESHQSIMEEKQHLKREVEVLNFSKIDDELRNLMCEKPREA